MYVLFLLVCLFLYFNFVFIVYFCFNSRCFRPRMPALLQKGGHTSYVYARPIKVVSLLFIAKLFCYVFEELSLL